MPLAPQLTVPALPPARLRLWQLAPRFHCSVIGTCLSMGDLRRLARKIGLERHRQADDYELHRSFVAIAATDGPAARLLQRTLDRRFGAELRRAARCPAGDLEALWEEAVADGEVAGTYWSLVSHVHTPAALKDRVYGDVHMLSHLSGASVRVDLQELARLRRRLPAVEEQLRCAQADARRQRRDQDAALRGLRDRIRQLEQRAHAAPTAGAGTRTAHLRRRLRRLLDIGRRLQNEAELARRRIRRAEDQAAALRAELRAVRGELSLWREAAGAAAPPEEPRAAADQTAACDLGGRCVLYVGGRDRPAARLRRLVEGRNGRFVHHDGGREQDRRQLDHLLPRADVVLCPVDCVSHDAAARVKQYCKRNDTCLLFLERSSAHAFEQGLQRYLGGLTRDAPLADASG